MTDLKIDTNGNLIIDPTTGREALVQGDEYLSQCIMLRLKTFKGDFLVHPSLGVGLENYIGQPLSDQTMDSIRQAVLIELSKITFLPLNEVYVADIDENTILIVVEFDSVEEENSTVDMAFTLDLVTGLVSQR